VEASVVTSPEYETFDLRVSATASGAYQVTIIGSPAGEASDLSPFDPTAPDLQNALQRLEAGVADAQVLAQFGCCLFDALFPAPIAALYRASLGLARAQGQPLRVRLRLDEQKLAALPWEYLFDGEEDCFLAASPETPLVRYMPKPFPSRPIAVRPPLRVLVLLCSPKDGPEYGLPLEVEREREIIEGALGDWIREGLVEHQVLDRGLASEISEAMRTFRPHVFHFVGHGSYDGDEVHVLLEDEAGRADLVGVRTFREFFLGRAETRLVVLNACQLARTSSTRPLAGLVSSLLQRNLSAVVAMQSRIPEHTALVFTREFYRSLAQGYPVDGAMAEARKGILLDVGHDAPDFGIPVLFLRARDGRLFEVKEGAEAESDLPGLSGSFEPPPPHDFVGRKQELDSRDFVGRKQELESFVRKLQDRHLVIITGIPGVGKTVLAEELVRQVDEPSRTFWHTFHEGHGVRDMIERLAGFLYWQGRKSLWSTLRGVERGGGRPLCDTMLLDYLFEELRGQQLLLCLDDLQYVEKDPLFEEFYERLDPARRWGDLRLIAISQSKPWFVSAGDSQELTGLSLEDAAVFLTRHGLSIAPADAAQGVVHDSAVLLTMKNLTGPDMVANLHARTGGNPMLLTLVADTLVRTSKPEHLFAPGRLFEQLIKGDYEQVQHFLVKEVDDSLTEEEQAVMTAVAVLRGYAGTREAIEAILEGKSVRDVLYELRRRHLLIVREEEDGHKYKLNAMLRYYYYDSLSRRQRHMMHLRAGEYYESEESDLLKAALHYERAGDAQKAVQLLTADVRVLVNQGRARLLRHLLERLAKARLDSQQQVLVRIAQGRVYKFLGDVERAVELYEEALASASQFENRRREAAVLGRLGNAFHSLGRNTRALKLHGEALRIARECGDRREESLQLSQLGMTHHALGLVDQAIALYQEALAITQELGDRRWEWHDLADLGRAYQTLGQGEQAIQFYEQALSICQEIGDRWGETKNLFNLGCVYRIQGRLARSIELYQESLASARMTGHRRGEGRTLGYLGLVHRSQGQMEWATEALDEALAITHDIGDSQNECFWLSNLGLVCYLVGQVERAMEYFEKAYALATEIGDRLQEGIALGFSGRASLLVGQVERARSCLEESLAVARETGYRRGEGYRLLDLCRLSLIAGELSEAREYCSDALALNMPGTVHMASLLSGIVGLHECTSTAEEAFANAAARCQVVLRETPDLYEARYTLAAALVGRAVRDPQWAVESRRSELLGLALEEYRKALENCAAPGVIGEAIRDLDLVQAAGIGNLELVVSLLSSNRNGTN
jgi:tetratricopeptide (TPR) repeat protein